jgi:nitrate reductase gamma subunit
MKNTVVGILAAFGLCLLAVDTGASWLIDAERYHVSAHSQNSCQDCHADIADKSLHPDPAEVNKTLPDFYRLEQCTACHEEVLEDVNEGSHGGEKIADEQAFNFCIGCHDPHYQLSYSDEATKLDLTQPVEIKCSICHELYEELPEFSSEDENCLSCHRSVDPEDPKETGYISNLCFHCHGQSAEAQKSESFARIDVSAYSTTVHADIPCITCHLEAVEFEHVNQKLGDCRDCHNLHDEKMAHDAHVRISCEACHLNQVSPVKAADGAKIRWHINRKPDDISAIHKMVSSNDDSFCRRCHVSGNTIGAAAMVLPAKSVMCMPCHAATFSAGDTTTLIALLFFGLGVLGAGSIWFSGSLVGAAESGVGSKFLKAIQSILAVIFSSRIFSILEVLILDGLLQGRLFRISRSRWLIHALIFFPFLIRFFWGLIALIATLSWPQWQRIWIMLDKNHPFTAFLFDLSGVLVILGVILLLVRKHVQGSKRKLEGLPGADWPAYSLMGGIIIVGFILEGMRIAMTGTPQGSQYAFLGYVISRLFAGADLTGIYGYIWYLHAIFTGAFVAYLPFSRMFHMIMAPVSLAINATSRCRREAI